MPFSRARVSRRQTCPQALAPVHIATFGRETHMSKEVNFNRRVFLMCFLGIAVMVSYLWGGTRGTAEDLVFYYYFPGNWQDGCQPVLPSLLIRNLRVIRLLSYSSPFAFAATSIFACFGAPSFT